MGKLTDNQKLRMETDPAYREHIMTQRRLYARKYRASLKERKAPKMCEKCSLVIVTHKYCKPCSRIVRLERYKTLWATNEEYRQKHRLAAKLSFRRKAHSVKS
jgi:hypothetical protein